MDFWVVAIQETPRLGHPRLGVSLFVDPALGEGTHPPPCRTPPSRGTKQPASSLSRLEGTLITIPCL